MGGEISGLNQSELGGGVYINWAGGSISLGDSQSGTTKNKKKPSSKFYILDSIITRFVCVSS